MKLNPRFASGYYGRATILCDREQLDRAIIEFNRAIEIDTNLVTAYANRGLALLRQGKDDEAARDFVQALRLDPSMKEELEPHISKVKELRQKQN
ncbi:MAG: tetratricopeptide repeat protein [Acidobacteriota bacterium]